MAAAAQYGNRVALITGCGKAGGIGAACAAALAAAGIAVVVADVQAQGVKNKLQPEEGATMKLTAWTN